jgi:four helix bundle protein
MGRRDLHVLDVAEQVVNELIELSSLPRCRLLFRAQLLDSAHGICRNIAEAFGRGTKPDRDRVLFIARGEAEETLENLAPNFRARRMEPGVFWRLHNRVVTIIKMLDELMR